MRTNVGWVFLPDKPDGMTTFASSKANEIIIVRNHEINPGASAKDGPFGYKNFKLKDIRDDLIYDKGKFFPCTEGTTTVIYDVNKQDVIRQFLSLT